jgi:hypothetical protein
VGNAAAIDYATLPAFAAATSTNSNSRSKQVQFMSPWNLRLAGTSLGDTALIGLPITRLGLDIDNQPRDPFKPYMGCDEALSHPLPVALTKFEVQAFDKDALIKWQTSSELNNKGFYLERSFDGLRFEAIAFYEGKGNTNTLTNYQHLDKDILMANSSIYYKLIQEDFDGTKRVLGVRLILSNEANQHLILVYPNPTSDYIWIKGPETASFEKIELYTLDGKLARNWDFLNLAAVTSILKLDVLGLSQGLYLLHMKIGNHVYVRKFNLK